MSQFGCRLLFGWQILRKYASEGSVFIWGSGKKAGPDGRGLRSKNGDKHRYTLTNGPGEAAPKRLMTAWPCRPVLHSVLSQRLGKWHDECKGDATTPNCRSNSAFVRLSSVKVGADFCRRAAFAVLLSFSLTLQAAPIRVAVSEFADYSVNLPVIPATIAVLEETFGKENVETHVYSVANLLAAAKTGQFDFMLTSPGAFSRLSIEGAGAVNLATVASARAPNPNFADDSVFFTLKDREDIREIADLRGRTVAANHKNGFSGWQTAMRERPVER